MGLKTRVVSLAGVLLFGLLPLVAAIPAASAEALTCGTRTATINAAEVRVFDFPNIQDLDAAYIKSLNPSPGDDSYEKAERYLDTLFDAKRKFELGRADDFTGAIVLGTPGNDVIVGTDEDDWIFGLDGHDVICGRKGDDILTGGAGVDWLLGNAGRDRVSASSKHPAEVLLGGSGFDTLIVHMQNGTRIQTVDVGNGKGTEHVDITDDSADCFWWA